MTRFLHSETIIAWGAAAFLWLTGILVTLHAQATAESPKFNQDITQDILMNGYLILAAAAILTGLISSQIIQTRHQRNSGADRKS